ncbi:MAG: PD-(D/E)XK nuclease superfamily protein [Myxococcales bacterium]
MRPQLQLTGFPVPAEEPRPTPEILERLRAWDARGTDGWVVAGQDPAPLSLPECRALAGLVDDLELSAAEFERLIALVGLGLGLDYRRKLVVGKTVYGRDREVDVLFRDARNGNRLAVEAKYQRVAGTADEKLPYAVLNQQTLPLPGVIVYGGGGFHLGALHWLCANTKATDIARLPEWLTVFFAL